MRPAGAAHARPYPFACYSREEAKQRRLGGSRFPPAIPSFPSASGRRRGTVRWGGTPVDARACRLGVRAWASLLKTEATAAVVRAWCFPSFLCYGLVAGEAVKLRRASLFSFASLAGRVGEGRSGGWTATRFCCRWFSVVPSDGFALAGRGGEGSSFWRWFRAGAGGPERHGGLWCSGGRRRNLEVAAAGARGLQDGDLATSGEVVWRWPQVWGGGSLGGSPGRWSFFGFKSSFSKLVAAAARQRLWARSFSAPLVRGAGSGFRRRLRRCRACLLGVGEVVVAVLQLLCLLVSFRSFDACIPICTVLLLV
jgi:hypothetical protein